MSRLPLHVRALLLFLAFRFVMGVGTVAGLNLVLPEMVDEFDTTLTLMTWMQLAYSLALVSGTFALGQTTALLDKRKLVVIALLADTALMVFSFYTHNIYLFIGARFLSALVRIYPWLILQVMGIGGFPAEQRGKILGIVGFMMGMGILLSVPVTGFVSAQWGWRWLFMGSGVLFAMLSVAVWFIIPTQPRPSDLPKVSFAQFDVPGSVLMMVAVVGILTALQAFVRGFEPFVGIATGGTGLLALGLFVWVERKTATPVVQFSIFKLRGVLTGATQAGLLGWVSGSTQLIIPLLFIVGYGWSVAHAAAVLFFLNILQPVAGLLSGWLSDKYGSSRIIAGAAVVGVMGQTVAATMNASPPVQLVVFALVLMGMGQAFMQVANQRQLFTSFPRHLLHLAPSSSLVLMTFGSTSGQALVAALLDTGREPVEGLADLGLVSAVRVALVIVTVVFALGIVISASLPRLLSPTSCGQGRGLCSPK
jgi:MFS family permease